MQISLEVASYRVEWKEIWDSGILEDDILGMFDLIVLSIILGLRQLLATMDIAPGSHLLATATAAADDSEESANYARCILPSWLLLSAFGSSRYWW